MGIFNQSLRTDENETRIALWNLISAISLQRTNIAPGAATSVAEVGLNFPRWQPGTNTWDGALTTTLNNTTKIMIIGYINMHFIYGTPEYSEGGYEDLSQVPDDKIIELIDSIIEEMYTLEFVPSLIIRTRSSHMEMDNGFYDPSPVPPDEDGEGGSPGVWHPRLTCSIQAKIIPIISFEVHLTRNKALTAILTERINNIISPNELDIYVAGGAQDDFTFLMNMTMRMYFYSQGGMHFLPSPFASPLFNVLEYIEEGQTSIMVMHFNHPFLDSFRGTGPDYLLPFFQDIEMAVEREWFQFSQGERSAFGWRQHIFVQPYIDYWDRWPFIAAGFYPPIYENHTNIGTLVEPLVLHRGIDVSGGLASNPETQVIVSRKNEHIQGYFLYKRNCSCPSDNTGAFDPNCGCRGWGAFIDVAIRNPTDTEGDPVDRQEPTFIVIRYAHLQSPLPYIAGANGSVSPPFHPHPGGATVFRLWPYPRLTLVGMIGTTGQSSGYHLHLEVRQTRAKDPDFSQEALNSAEIPINWDCSLDQWVLIDPLFALDNYNWIYYGLMDYDQFFE